MILLILIAAAFILISLLEINLNTGIYGKEQGHILGIFTLQLVILGCCTFLALHISKMNQRMNEGKIVAIQLDKQKAMIENTMQWRGQSFSKKEMWNRQKSRWQVLRVQSAVSE